VRGAPGVWLEILQAGEIPGPVGKDGTALLNISDLLKWVGEKRKQGRRWNDLTTKDFQDFFGKAMGFERPKSAQKGLYEEKRRYWFIPPLSACRQLWDDKKWTVTWPPNVDDWSGWEMLDKP